MATLLRIDSSSRLEGSFSRRFGDELAERLNAEHSIIRDLVKDPVPHIDVAAIAAFFSDPSGHGEAEQMATALSDALLDEIMAADDIMITVPMYNFGIPSALKAWIDQIVRIGKTFDFDGQNFAGLLQNKRAFLVIAYGADGYTQGDFKIADFVKPYLSFVLNFIGITDITIVPVEGTNVGKEAEAEAQARAIIASVKPRGQEK